MHHVVSERRMAFKRDRRAVAVRVAEDSIHSVPSLLNQHSSLQLPETRRRVLDREGYCRLEIGHLARRALPRSSTPNVKAIPEAS